MRHDRELKCGGGWERHRWLVVARLEILHRESGIEGGSGRRRETRGGAFQLQHWQEKKDPDSEPSGTICTPEGGCGFAVPPAFTTQMTKLELTCYFQTGLLIRAPISRPGVLEIATDLWLSKGSCRTLLSCRCYDHGSDLLASDSPRSLQVSV